MRSLLLLLVSAIFIIQSIGGVYASENNSYEQYDFTQYRILKGTQDVKIFEKNVFGTAVNDTESQMLRKALIAQCIEQRGLSNGECRDLVEQRLQATVKAVKGKNSTTLRRSISQGNLYWLHTAVLGENGTYSDIFSIKRYQDGFLFISASGHESDPSKYYFGFIRYNKEIDYLKVFMAPLAPAESSQYSKYANLYYVDDGLYSFDRSQFQKDLTKSFNKNRFNNKEIQEVYSQFLKFVDENTPTR